MNDRQRSIYRANKGLSVADGDPAPQFTKRGTIAEFQRKLNAVLERRKLKYKR